MMAGRGRPKLDRTNVEDRAWWDKIGRRDDHGDPRNGVSSADDHWEWLGEPNAVLYPSWKPKGEKPARVLFYHLRPDDWDGRAQWSKLVRTCGEETCINPWHGEFSKMTSRVPSLDAARVSESDWSEDPEVMWWVWSAYIGMLENRSPEYASIVLPDTGRVREHGYPLMNNDARAIVEFERLIARDVLPTLAEASYAYNVIREARVDQIRSARERFREKLAIARGEGPKEWMATAMEAHRRGRPVRVNLAPGRSPADRAAIQQQVVTGLYMVEEDE